MNPPLAFCQPNTGLPLVALDSLAAQESIVANQVSYPQRVPTVETFVFTIIVH